MTQANAVNITSPVGRIVQGDLYKPNTKAMDGSPLLVKTGANAGQPRVDFFFARAIPTGTDIMWWDTPWGQQILAVGAASFPQAYQRPDFAWKITDGDSTVPNKRNKVPNRQEGYPGHWVLKFSGGFAPKIFNANGSQALTDPGAVKCGYYVQVAFSVAGNNQAANPGVYLNHQMVALAGYGPEIFSGPDPESAGFGQAPLPAGASATPLAALPGAATAPATPAAPTVPVAAPPPSAVPVVPSSAILAPPPPTAAPAAPVAVGRQMLPKAGATPYEAFIAQGWTDATLIAHGYLAP